MSIQRTSNTQHNGRQTAWTFEEALYSPFASPLRPDVAAFLEELTAPRPLEAFHGDEEELYHSLTSDSVHRVDVYCFLQFLRGSAATWSTLLGNYVWVEEDEYGPRCIIWAAPTGFFVRGIPDEFREGLDALLYVKQRTAWQVG